VPNEPADVQPALAATGAQTIAWYGVRIFNDHWPSEEPPANFDTLLAVEEQAGCRDPYRAIAALTHRIW
jgi:S-adenosylmethionine-dependent methyltransferase